MRLAAAARRGGHTLTLGCGHTWGWAPPLPSATAVIYCGALSALLLSSGVRTLALLHTALQPLLAPSAAVWLEAALPLLATMALQLAVGGAAVAVGCRDGCANGAPRG